MFFPGGIYTMTWAPTLMWGIYYAAIPDIGSRVVRITLSAAIVLFHLGFAYWAAHDSALLLAFREYPLPVLLHATLFVLALAWLVYFALNQDRAKSPLPPGASTQQALAADSVERLVY